MLVGSEIRSTPHAAGVLYGIGAYGLWGVFPLYFKAIREVPALEVVAHRIVWSLAFLTLLLAVRHGWQPCARRSRNRGTVVILA